MADTFSFAEASAPAPARDPASKTFSFAEAQGQPQGQDWGSQALAKINEVGSAFGQGYMEQAAPAVHTLAHDVRKEILPRNLQEYLSNLTAGAPTKPALDALGALYGTTIGGIAGGLEHATRPGGPIAPLPPGWNEHRARLEAKLERHGVPKVLAKALTPEPRGIDFNQALLADMPGLAELKGERAMTALEKATRQWAFNSGDIEHARDARRLMQEDKIRLTPGQRNGGIVRRTEEIQHSNPLAGQAIRGAESTAIRDFNRALYNRILKNVGVSVPQDAKASRSSVDYVEKTLSQQYDALKPQIQVSEDHGYAADLAAVSKKAARLGPQNFGIFKRIVAEDVKPHFQGGRMNGATFKRVEGDLTRQANEYRKSGSPHDRELARRIDEVNEALRSAMERSSAPNVREKLRKLNTSWAMFARLRDAAVARKGSMGMVSTGDLLGALKRADRSAGKGSFARGDALLQDFAERAHRVLPDKVPDSHTSERSHNLLEFLLGWGTNPVVRAVMDSRTNHLMNTGAASRALPARGPAALYMGNATNQLNRQQQQ